MVKVIIVGGGVAGLTSAYSLSSLGLEVIIYEKESSPQNDPGIGIIAPNGSYALSQLGLFDYLYIKGLGVSYVESSYHDLNDRIINRVPCIASGGKYQGRSYFYPDLIDTLNYCVKKQGLVKIIYKEVIEVTMNAENVQVSLSDGSLDTCDFVIGADGINSSLREQYFPTKTGEFHIRNTGRVGIVTWCKVDIKADNPIMSKMRSYLRKQELHHILSPNCEVLITYNGNGKVSLCISVSEETINKYFNIKNGRNFISKLSSSMIKNFVQDHLIFNIRNEVLKYLIDNSFWFESNENKIEENSKCNPYIWFMDDINLPSSFINDRLLLIGDSGHAILPNSYQSLSQTFEDIMFLQQILIQEGLIQSIEQIRNFIQKYNQIRYERVSLIHKNSRSNYYNIFPPESYNQYLFQRIYETYFSPQPIKNSYTNLLNKYIIESNETKSFPISWFVPILKVTFIGSIFGSLFLFTIQRKNIKLWR